MAEETAPAPATISEEEVSALLEADRTDGVRPYDLTAIKINRSQLPLLDTIGKTFAQRAQASLATLLGREVALQLASLDSAKAADVQAALPVPTTLAVARLKPLPGACYFSVEPALLLTLLDGFFGGSGRAPADPQAATAPAAQRFLALMLRGFAADAAVAWAPVKPVELEVLKLETNPRLVQIGAPAEVVFTLRFSVEFGARSGWLDWLLPESLLAPVREALAGAAIETSAPQSQAWGPALGAALAEAEIETRAVLTEARISLRELVKLAPGDIIPIEPPQTVALIAGDVALYRGRFGVSQGRNAIKIVPGGAA